MLLGPEPLTGIGTLVNAAHLDHQRSLAQTGSLYCDRSATVLHLDGEGQVGSVFHILKRGQRGELVDVDSVGVEHRATHCGVNIVADDGAVVEHLRLQLATGSAELYGAGAVDRSRNTENHVVEVNVLCVAQVLEGIIVVHDGIVVNAASRSATGVAVAALSVSGDGVRSVGLSLNELGFAHEVNVGILAGVAVGEMAVASHVEIAAIGHFVTLVVNALLDVLSLEHSPLLARSRTEDSVVSLAAVHGAIAAHFDDGVASHIDAGRSCNVEVLDNHA